jgi:hypothetical protein
VQLQQVPRLGHTATFRMGNYMPACADCASFDSMEAKASLSPTQCFGSGLDPDSIQVGRKKLRNFMF